MTAAVVTNAVVVTEPIQSDVVVEVVKQYRQEAQGVKYEEDFILKQRYGLVAPQLTGAENNIIRREAKNAGR